MSSRSGRTSESRIGRPERRSLRQKKSSFGLEWPVERHREVPVGIEALDALHVEHGRRSREVLPVGGREGVAVAGEELRAALLAALLDERAGEVVGPGARRLEQPRLDLADVHVVGASGPRVHDVVEPREDGLRQAHVVVDADAAELVHEDALDGLAHARVEAIARDEDEAREEAPVGVTAQEEPDARALAEVEDAHGDLEEVVVGDLEELVAGVRLQDLDQRLVVVAPRGKARALPHLARLPPQQRDLVGPRAVRGRGVEAEEAPLADDLPVLAEPLHAHVVEVRGPMDRRPRVRLREDEGVVRARPVARLAGELDGALVVVAVAHDPEPRPGNAAKRVLAVLGDQVVLVEAEEREVVVHDPLEEGPGLGQVLGVDRRRVRVQVGDDLVRARDHRLPVVDGCPHVPEDAPDSGLQLGEMVGIGLAHDLRVDEGLEPAVGRVRVVREHVEELPVPVPPDARHRVDDQVHAAPEPVELHAHRVDEEGHVVVDDLDDGVRRLPAVLLELRGVDVDLGRARRALRGQVEVGERRAVEVGGAALEQVVRCDGAVVEADEDVEARGVLRGEPSAGVLDRLLDQRRLCFLGLHLVASRLPPPSCRPPAAGCRP